MPETKQDAECPTCEGHGCICEVCGETPDHCVCDGNLTPCERCDGEGVLDA